MSGKLFFGVSLAERARAEEKNHRGTEGTEKGCDLCVLCGLCVLCVSVSLWFNRLHKTVVQLGAISEKGGSRTSPCNG